MKSQAVKFNRRKFLKAVGTSVGVAATGSFLAACAAPAAAPAAKPAEGATAAPAAAAGGGGKLEIFSWWTNGGEVDGLNAMYEIYKAKYPGVEIINAAIAGGSGAGGNAKAVLKTRMLGGDPPDSFQVHLGRELIDTHVVAERMEGLSDFYKSEGLDQAFPQGVIDLAGDKGVPYSVPVNIHRSNVMWYNKKLLADGGVDKPPTTWDEYWAAAEKLKAKGIAMCTMAGSGAGFSGHEFENILLAVLGTDGYAGLFTGATSWADAKVGASLEALKKMLDYAVPNYAALQWGDTDALLVEGKAATHIMGDWMNGYFKSKKFTDWGWVPAPGTAGTFLALSDSFGLPKGVKNRDNVLNWLKVCGSKEGQDAFNPLKGSIPARKDADLSKYDEYQKQAITDFASNKIVGSIVHGAAAKESFVNDFNNVIAEFVASKDVAGAGTKLAEAAKLAGYKA
jgi:glucose/mannose transport system substrate-binding protein